MVSCATARTDNVFAYLPGRIGAPGVGEVELRSPLGGEASQHAAHAKGAHASPLCVALLCLGDIPGHVFNGGGILAGQLKALSLHACLSHKYNQTNYHKVIYLFNGLKMLNDLGHIPPSQSTLGHQP